MCVNEWKKEIILVCHKKNKNDIVIKKCKWYESVYSLEDT